MTSRLDTLPVELVADILGELDLATLIIVSYLSRRLHAISSDNSLNPWRRPINRNLSAPVGTQYEPCMKHLSVRHTVPRQNWIEILSMARASWLLYDATLPNMKESEWEECFKRRFLPGWQRWKKEGTWREAFKKALYRVWHRNTTSCTADESWTKYIVLNRNGSANELEASSRNYSPLAIFNEMKLQNNLAHLETHIRLVVEFADVRIIALGVLHKPISSFTVNRNARLFLHPPGVERDENEGVDHHDSSIRGTQSSLENLHRHGGVSPSGTSTTARVNQTYRRLTQPLPCGSHINYPFYTPGGEDKRWIGSGEYEEGGRQWVGPLMLTAQLVGPHTKDFVDGPFLQDLDLVLGLGRSQYASLTWSDLSAIAPWLDITKRIDGPGLGN